MRILKYKLRGLGSPGTVIALLALCIALSGTALAASLINSADVKNNSLRGVDVRDESLTKRDFRGSVRGRRGPRGRVGPRGPAGSAVAYAHIYFLGSDPVVDPNRSKNVSGVSRFPGSEAGRFCVSASVPVEVATVTTGGVLDPDPAVAEVGYTGRGRPECDRVLGDAVVEIERPGVGLVDVSFTIVFN